MDQLLNGDVSLKLTRASVACRRCRRLRVKCENEGGKPPCAGCRNAGRETVESCVFVVRGHSHHDRQYRAARQRNCDTSPSVRPRLPDPQSSDTSTVPVQKPSEVIHPSPTPSVAVATVALYKSGWESLPPHEEVIEGCKAFWTCCLQVGFIPKRLFLERLSQDRDSVNVFLLFGILSVSARFTPCLLRRYDGASSATNYFVNHASSWVYDSMYEPSLENIQAFFLLAVAQWGHSDRMRSSMHMGIGIRMAGILKLHREETYSLPENANADEIALSEMARRTFWVLETQDHLQSEHASPVPFSPKDITALLPCKESDWAFGRIPAERAAMPGTKAADDHPQLTNLPSRSLFATLLQAHNHWGNVARRACRSDHSNTKVAPWNNTSNFLQTIEELDRWEAEVPPEHRWSVWNMRGQSAKSLQAAFMSIVMVTRLSNIVIRRIYLEDMKDFILNGQEDGSPPNFWKGVASELFKNMFALHDSVDMWIKLRAEGEGYGALLLFSLYVCGTLSVQLLKNPELCLRQSSQATYTLNRSLHILCDLQPTWPLASRWTNALKINAGSLLSSGEASHTLADSALAPPVHCDISVLEGDANRQRNRARKESTVYSIERRDTVELELPDNLVTSRVVSGGAPEATVLPNDSVMNSSPNRSLDEDSFEKELLQFLLGESHNGIFGD